MIGIIHKTIRESWFLTMLLAVGATAFASLLTFILPQLLEQAGEIILQMTLAKTLISALLGVELDDQITAQMMQAVLWVHPAILAIVWAHEIAFCTRLPAAEIDRGTIDFLFGLPVSRRLVYVSETLVWLSSGLLIFLMAGTGHLVTSSLVSGPSRPDMAILIAVLINFFCLYVCVGGLTLLVSSCCDRRGRAVGITMGLVLCSFLLNFLASIWAPAQAIAFLGFLEYYRPAEIFASGQFPWVDIVVLLAVGAVTWTTGCEITARRSICTI